MGVYWGLRRLADDAGRFLLLDLGDADGEVLDDLILGLGPFASGVLAAPAQREAWRRFGSPHVGRVERVATAAEIAEARRTAADAVLAPAVLADEATALGLARLGGDDAADLGLVPRAAAPWIECRDVPADRLPPGAAGYLATAPFWQEIAGSERAERRRRIADDLVPRLQRLNVAALDTTRPDWLDRTHEEET